MPYTKTNWKDRVVQNPLTYTQKANADGSITLTPAPGTVTQQGTPVNASALNNLEKQYDTAMTETEQRDYKVYKTNKDTNGVYVTVQFKRNDGTLAMESTLSGGLSPQYTTRTIKYYAADGITLQKTTTRTLTYDSDGDLASEV